MLQKTWLRTLIVAALAVLPWLGGLDVEELVWEGNYLVGDNPLLDEPDVVLRAFGEPWASGVGPAGARAKNQGYYRPVATLDLALEKTLWGEDPVGWRAGALVLHGGIAVALLWVLELAAAGPAAPILALAYAWHPLHSEVIGSVAYRTTALTILLGLLALGVLARWDGRSRPRLVLGLVLATLAFFTKETALTFVAVIPLTLFALDPGPVGRRRALVVASALAVLAGGWWLIRSQIVLPTPGAILGELSLGDRLALMTKTTAHLAGIVVWPRDLNPHYDISVFYPPLVDLRTWIGLLLIGGVGGLAVLGLRRRRPWAFALLAALATLGPVSGIIPLRVLVADRFLVLPVAFALVAVALAVGASRWRPAGLGRRAAVVAVMVILGVLGTRSWSRMTDWRSVQVLLEARVRDFPGSVDAQLGLGDHCLTRGDLDCARVHVDLALEIYPGYPIAEGIRAEIDAAAPREAQP
ncbi:MAG: hypothetical protein ABIK09_06275 [Pseudomonadota bacterium]